MCLKQWTQFGSPPNFFCSFCWDYHLCVCMCAKAKSKMIFVRVKHMAFGPSLKTKDRIIYSDMCTTFTANIISTWLERFSLKIIKKHTYTHTHKISLIRCWWWWRCFYRFEYQWTIKFRGWHLLLNERLSSIWFYSSRKALNCVKFYMHIYVYIHVCLFFYFSWQ